MNTNMNPNIIRHQHTLDAQGKVLGRFATEVANLLRGKNKVDFVYHLDIGDFVAVVNSNKIVFTGDKINQKVYRTHSGYIGSLKEISLSDLFKSNPDKIIYKAVWGMLPKNRLRKKWINRLTFKKLIKDTNG